MKFLKDILVLDLETSGPDPERDHIIQIGAVLLDKDNLLEKDFFNEYVKASLLQDTTMKHAAMLNIPFETLTKSKRLVDVLKKFTVQFDRPYLLASHNIKNIFFWKNGFKKAPLPLEFDYRILELWTIGYIYTVNMGIRKLPTFDTFAEHFNIKIRNPHNAFERAKLSCEILRNIIQKV